MSSSVHVDYKKNNILILGEGIRQGLDSATLTAEKMYSVNFTENNKKCSLGLHCNEAKNCEIVSNLLCLGNISEDFY